MKTETYRITIKNNISGKKRFLNIESISFERAVQQAGYMINYSSEEIIKAVLFS